MVCPQVLCLAFWPFFSICENLGDVWSNLHVEPHSGIHTHKMCPCALLQVHFPNPTLTVEIKKLDFHTQWMETIKDA